MQNVPLSTGSSTGGGVLAVAACWLVLPRAVCTMGSAQARISCHAEPSMYAESSHSLSLFPTQTPRVRAAHRTGSGCPGRWRGWCAAWSCSIEGAAAGTALSRQAALEQASWRSGSGMMGRWIARMAQALAKCTSNTAPQPQVVVLQKGPLVPQPHLVVYLATSAGEAGGASRPGLHGARRQAGAAEGEAQLGRNTGVRHRRCGYTRGGGAQRRQAIDMGGRLAGMCQPATTLPQLQARRRDREGAREHAGRHSKAACRAGGSSGAAVDQSAANSTKPAGTAAHRHMLGFSRIPSSITSEGSKGNGRTARDVTVKAAALAEACLQLARQLGSLVGYTQAAAQSVAQRGMMSYRTRSAGASRGCRGGAGGGIGAGALATAGTQQAVRGKARQAWPATCQPQLPP